MCEYQRRELGLPIRFPWRVPPCSLQIVEIDEPSSMCQAADVYNSRPACPPQQWHQPSGESKVTKIICSKLHLKAIAVVCRRGHTITAPLPTSATAFRCQFAPI